jgi:hypothetical protein
MSLNTVYPALISLEILFVALREVHRNFPKSPEWVIKRKSRQTQLEMFLVCKQPEKKKDE